MDTIVIVVLAVTILALMISLWCWVALRVLAVGGGGRFKARCCIALLGIRAEGQVEANDRDQEVGPNDPRE